LVLLPMFIDYFHGCVERIALALQLKIKIMVEPSSVFTGLWFGLYVIFLRLP
jgi:hypothetical protein